MFGIASALTVPGCFELIFTGRKISRIKRLAVFLACLTGAILGALRRVIFGGLFSRCQDLARVLSRALDRRGGGCIYLQELARA